MPCRLPDTASEWFVSVLASPFLAASNLILGRWYTYSPRLKAGCFGGSLGHSLLLLNLTGVVNSPYFLALILYYPYIPGNLLCVSIFLMGIPILAGRPVCLIRIC